MIGFSMYPLLINGNISSHYVFILISDRPDIFSITWGTDKPPNLNEASEFNRTDIRPNYKYDLQRDSEP